jgi:ABC-2 type transport system permease protein
MLKRLKHMLVKEFLQMLRDPRMRVVVFVLPVVQMCIIAFALTMDVMNIKTAVLDLDNSRTSRRIIREFTAGGYFRVIMHLRSPSEMAVVLDSGRAKAVIHFPAGFENRVKSGRTATVQLLADGSDSNNTAIIMGYANGIIQSYTNRKMREQLQEILGTVQSPGSVEIEQRAFFNTNLESPLYYVPGLIGVMLIVSSMTLTSIGVVREKEIGTIEQVMVTPIRRLEFILGKAIPPIITGYITMTLMLTIAMLVFGVRIMGNWLLLYCLTGVYLMGNIGLALLVSAISTTQQQAFLTAFFIIIPCVLLSGFMFPVHNMPVAVQYMTFLNPIRWYLEILRGVVMKGVGIKTLWPAITAQITLAITFVLVASLRFKKTLE